MLSSSAMIAPFAQIYRFHSWFLRFPRSRKTPSSDIRGPPSASFKVDQGVGERTNALTIWKRIHQRAERLINGMSSRSEGSEICKRRDGQ